jgi:hypothetical protein
VDDKYSIKDSPDDPTLEGDKLLLVEFDHKREEVLRRIQDLVFEEEFRQNSRRVEVSPKNVV